MPGKNILVVEDEEDILELITYNLTREGYKVKGVMSGEEAIEAAIPDRIDLILLDIMLPGTDGLDVCRRLKGDAKTAAIPIIMVSAKGEEADIVVGLELGAEDHAEVGLPGPAFPAALRRGRKKIVELVVK